jgi:hypothetical protein
MAPTDGRIENPEGEMKIHPIFAQNGLSRPFQPLFLLR